MKPATPKPKGPHTAFPPLPPRPLFSAPAPKRAPVKKPKGAKKP